jgi:hypothetical protein
VVTSNRWCCDQDEDDADLNKLRHGFSLDHPSNQLHEFESVR